ncbi:MAG TPA: homogentisate 1,2-dioxygenase [Acidimicrobiia bacterium]|nr:homogentisate 1,2-dioxygenase [Acidimicrobiia bacterium]
MPYYRRIGDVPRKRHTLHEHDGAVVFEELIGVEGFSGPSSLLYHRRSPSAIVRIDAADVEPITWHANQPLRPQHVRTSKLAMDALDVVLGRVALLGNDDVCISYVTATATSPLYRSAVGDELAFVHEGDAVIESVFGALAVGAGDYVIVPAGVTHRWVVPNRAEVLIVAATGHVSVPTRYLNAVGQFVEGAPFSERDVRAPEPAPAIDEDDVPVLVRTRMGWSSHVHAHHPFDVVGWDGYVYPWAFNIHDFEPIVGRIHQPPPVHQTFAGPSFVVCSFVPRPYDFDPRAVKVPYHHSNVDSDEVLFYSRGNFMSRAGSGIGEGSMSLHPPGFVHGPQPGSRERSAQEDRTEELAVMLDAFRPLALSEAAIEASDPDYGFSWSR